MTRKSKFGDAFWGTDFCGTAGFDVLQKRMKEGRQMSKDMEQFFKQRAKVEEEYAKNLQKCVKQAGGNTEIGSLKEAWDCMRLQSDKMAQEHIDLSNALNEAAGRVSIFAEKQKTKRRPEEDNVTDSHRKKKKNFEKVIEVKKNYEKLSHEAEMVGYQEAVAKTAGQNSMAAKEWDKLFSRNVKAKQEATRSEQVYRQSLDSLEQIRLQWEHHMKHACEVFEKLEEDRIGFMRNELWVHCNTLSKTWVDDDDHSEHIRQTLENCNINNDIELFVKTRNTGREKPARVEYEPYQSGSGSATISSRPPASIPPN